MGELAGGLIQMNAKMVVTNDANTLIVGGMIVAVVFLAMTVIMATEKVTDKKRAKRKMIRTGVCAAAMLAGIALVIAGNNMPRVKEIRACASGPVSLEVIATQYDIIDVDGKELVLRARGK